MNSATYEQDFSTEYKPMYFIEYVIGTNGMTKKIGGMYQSIIQRLKNLSKLVKGCQNMYIELELFIDGTVHLVLKLLKSPFRELQGARDQINIEYKSRFVLYIDIPTWWHEVASLKLTHKKLNPQ